MEFVLSVIYLALPTCFMAYIMLACLQKLDHIIARKKENIDGTLNNDENIDDTPNNGAKNYIIDTNVIIADPDCFFKFADNNIIIPDTVIEELDNHKKDGGDVGYNVRKACRTLDRLSKKSFDSNDCTNISLGEGGTLTFISDSDYTGFPKSWSHKKNDNRILSIANYTQNKINGDAIIVSRDINMRIKARILGIEAQNYRHESVEEDYLAYNGRTIAYTDESVYSRFANGEAIDIKDLVTEAGEELKENEFVILKPDNDSDVTGIGMVHGQKLCRLKHMQDKPYDIVPRNLGQHLAVEALMAPADEIPLVILKGSAGTAKTFLALACGLEQVINKRTYRRITISRANVPFDNDIGALPGDEQEKIGPLLRGCMDNLEQLICGEKITDDITDGIDDKIWYVFQNGWVKAEALGFLRGRSLNDQILYIDEAQNTTASQMNGILTRAGEGCKIVIAGDLSQIDTPRLDRHNNGLAHALKLMAGDPDCCVIGFTDEEATRSRLARKVAAKIEAERGQNAALNMDSEGFRMSKLGKTEH